MKQEDLFLAIAAADDDWLLQSEDDIANHVIFVPKSRKQLSKAILVAVITVSILALTACAAIGFLFFDTPLEMLDTLFGTNTKYVQSERYLALSKSGCGTVCLGGFERFPIDAELAEDLEKKIHPVGQSIRWHDYILTVDGYLYDSATGCGVIAYAIECPEGKSLSHFYRVQKNGALNYRDGELVHTDYTHRDYLVKEKSDDQKLVIASYFYNGDRTGELQMHLSYGTYMSSAEFSIYFDEAQSDLPKPITTEVMNAILQKWEDMKQISPDAISIDLESEKSLDHIEAENGAILVSPMALIVNRELLGMDGKRLSDVVIVFDDGTEFVVHTADTENFFLHYDKTDSDEVCYLFNRLIDISSVFSIRIQDSEFVFE